MLLSSAAVARVPTPVAALGKLMIWTESNEVDVLPSQLFLPRAGQPPYPILVFLHGGGDGPFDVMNRQSLPSLLLNNKSFADEFPFIVIAPCSTCSGNSRGWTTPNLPKVQQLVARTISQHRGDPTRVSLTGQSMGGGGLWHYASKAPRMWSALVPVCAAARPSQSLADGSCCKQGPAHGCCPPVWAFHGANDRVVPVTYSDRMIEMLRAHTLREVRYTRYEDAPPPPMHEFGNLIGHGSYELAYRDPELYAWLLRQRCDACARVIREGMGSTPPKARQLDDASTASDIASTSTLAPPASPPPPWPPAVLHYREILQTFSKDVHAFASAARELRAWMAATDPDYPLYHLAPPEGWANDPNGVTYDPADGLYHRFFQYDKTYDEGCRHGLAGASLHCETYGYKGRNVLARTWGHTVSKDLAVWEDWPGIDADSEWDAIAVYSGNCAIDDDGHPVCIYSGGHEQPCDTGVCAYSHDWIHWNKSACMRKPPSVASQVNHDTSIYRVGKLWHLLIGGCTYGGTNIPTPGVACAGNAQLWTSTDLRTIEYAHPLTPGGPTGYWELPYLLPFDEHGHPLPNDQMANANTTALLFGAAGNKYWVGGYDSTLATFTPLGAAPRSSMHINKSVDASPPGWPTPNISDSHAYYSFNPHATDNRGPGGSTRRLVFGWVQGVQSAACRSGRVPYWQSAHSLARLVEVRGSSMSQLPAPEVGRLRATDHHHLLPRVLVQPGTTGHVPGVSGDSLELRAVFSLSARETNASSFGLQLRVLPGFACTVGYTVAGRTLAVNGSSRAWPADIIPQPSPDTVHLHVFLDRSIIEVYSGGAAVTARCLLPAAPGGTRLTPTVDAYAVGGVATLLSLESWQMRSMWGSVT